MLRKGCQGYLDYVVETEKEGILGDEIPVVREFLDVFPDDIAGLPPEREVKFTIDCRCRSRHDDGSDRARVRASDRGRRRLPHSGSEAVSSYVSSPWLGWRGRRDREERRRGDFRSELE